MLLFAHPSRCLLLHRRGSSHRAVAQHHDAGPRTALLADPLAQLDQRAGEVVRKAYELQLARLVIKGEDSGRVLNVAVEEAAERDHSSPVIRFVLVG